MTDFPTHLMPILFTGTLLFVASLDHAMAQEEAPPAVISSIAEKPSSSVQEMSGNELDALAEAVRTGAEPEAVAKLEAQADLGNRRALHLLGDLYSKGPLPIDGAKAVDYYNRGVAAGHIASLVALGDLYREGALVERDLTKAEENYRRAATEGHETAQLRLGSALIKGTFGDADPERGLPLLEALAAKENPWALHELGELYSKGPLPLNGLKAVDYYSRSVAGGNTFALVRLGDLHNEGSLVEKDLARAEEYYKQAADEGHETAQLRLGSALIKGTFSEVDPEKGLSLLEALAENENRLALYELGEIYSKGPLPLDGIKAVDYYTRSIAAGHIASLVALGDLYREGALVERDLTKAEENYRRAAAEGHETAQLRLGSALIKGTFGDADPERGLSLLEALAAKENPWALHELGELYSKGPLPLNGLKAVDYYSRSVALGHTVGLVRLGDIYREGRLVKADPSQAITFYEKAQSEGQSSALRNLALGHVDRQFGRLSKPSMGAKMLQEAVNSGDISASSALANLYFDGKGLEKDPKRGLQLLHQAAEAGNASAARTLVSVLRNGRGEDLSRNLSQAETALNKYAVLFSQEDLNLELIMLQTARADSKKDFAAVAALMQDASPSAQQRMLVMAHGSNRNVYTWLLQKRLAELDLYKGSLNGIMTTSTIRAVSAYCRQNDVQAECMQGPLDWRTARVLAERLY